MTNMVWHRHQAKLECYEKNSVVIGFKMSSSSFHAELVKVFGVHEMCHLAC